MANNIEKVDLIQKMLDKAMVQGAVTGFMEANAGPVKYSGGDEIKIPSIAMDGLKDYDRQLGFAEGDVTLVYQTERLTQDRGTGFTVDEMEVDESGVLDLMSLLAGEFQRTKVVPEVDAYRLSKIAKLVGKDRRSAYTAAANSVYKELQNDIGGVRDAVGSDVPLVVILSSTIATMLSTSTEISKKLDVTNFKRGEIETRVKVIDEVPILPAPTARMNSRITINKADKGGYAKAEGAQAINWIICPRSAPIAVSKTDKMRLFDPETWQKARAWHLDYRKFHELWIPKNKLDGFRVSLAAKDTTLDGEG